MDIVYSVNYKRIYTYQPKCTSKDFGYADGGCQLLGILNTVSLGSSKCNAPSSQIANA